MIIEQVEPKPTHCSVCELNFEPGDRRLSGWPDVDGDYFHWHCGLALQFAQYNAHRCTDPTHVHEMLRAIR